MPSLGWLKGNALETVNYIRDKNVLIGDWAQLGERAAANAFAVVAAVAAAGLTPLKFELPHTLLHACVYGVALGAAMSGAAHNVK